MNLQEVLDYRKECLICGNELSFIHKDLHISVKQNGLECARYLKDSVVYFDEDAFVLNFDGKAVFKKNNAYVLGITPNPLNLIKACSKCNRGQGVPREYGLSSVIETMCDQYHYSFDIFAKNGSFSIHKNHEFVSYMTLSKLHHIETSFIKQESKVYYGGRLEGMYNKTLPMVNLQNIKTRDALINKIKLITTFS